MRILSTADDASDWSTEIAVMSRRELDPVTETSWKSTAIAAARLIAALPE